MEKSVFQKEIVLTLSKHNYELREKIGKGGFASVYKCKNHRYNEIFCVKIIEIPEDANEALSITFDSEFKTLIKIIHPNIITLFDHFQSPHCLYLILEYCPNGSLLDLIKKTGPFDMPKLIDYYQQILQATDYIHSIKIAHRDIKPQNILFDIHNRPKLADFGLAEFFRSSQGEKLRFGGSIPYMAPELIKLNEFSPEAVDVWALGITFFQMATGSLPWVSNSIQAEIVSGFICFPSDLDEQVLYLLKKMLHPDPSRRPTCKQLLQFPIFNTNSNSESNQQPTPLMHSKQVSYFSPLSSSKKLGQISSSSSLINTNKSKRRIKASGSSVFFKKRVSLSYTFSDHGSEVNSDNGSDSLLK